MEDYSIFNKTRTARTINYHCQSALTCSKGKCIPRKYLLPVEKREDSSCIQYVIMWEETTTGTFLLCVWLYGTSERLLSFFTFVSSVHRGHTASLPLLLLSSFSHLWWWYTRSSEKVLTRVHTHCSLIQIEYINNINRYTATELNLLQSRIKTGSFIQWNPSWR